MKIVDHTRPIRQLKKRQLLVVSASTPFNGLEILHIEIEGYSWNILKIESIKLPKNIEQNFEGLVTDAITKITMEELAFLDKTLSHTLLEGITTSLHHLPKSKQKPHIILFKRLHIWKGFIKNDMSCHPWIVSIGDPHFLAFHMKIPVLSDFVHTNIIQNEMLAPPLLTGTLLIAKKIAPLCVFVHIGACTRLTIIDAHNNKIIVDTECGPGTRLIDMTATETGCTHDIDRDGCIAKAGVVNISVLEELMRHEWFKSPNPKLFPSELNHSFASHPFLKELSGSDRIATVTALCALATNTVYKKEYSFLNPPDAFIYSGGGAHNLALVEFLKAYFSPLVLQSSEGFSIPPAMFSNVALALTFHLQLNRVPIQTDKTVSKGEHILGRWFYP